MDPIDTATQLRQVISEQIGTIKQLDPLPKARRQTAAYRSKLIKEYGLFCAYCASDTNVQAAHIVPLEIGGSTDETNLILLCKKCHKRFDSGHMSISDMRKLATRWHSRPYSPPSNTIIAEQSRPAPTVTPPPRSVEHIFEDLIQYQRERKYVKGLRLIEKNIFDSAICDSGRIYLMIKRAELMRRRAAHGVLEKAHSYLQEIDPI